MYDDLNKPDEEDLEDDEDDDVMDGFEDEF